MAGLIGSGDIPSPRSSAAGISWKGRLLDLDLGPDLYPARDMARMGPVTVGEGDVWRAAGTGADRGHAGVYEIKGGDEHAMPDVEGAIPTSGLGVSVRRAIG